MSEFYPLTFLRALFLFYSHLLHSYLVKKIQDINEWLKTSKIKSKEMESDIDEEMIPHNL